MKKRRLIMSLVLAASIAGCASEQPGKVVVIPEKDAMDVSQPLPPSPNRVPARFFWKDALVEKVKVPGRVVGGVFQPAHEELVLVAPAGYRVTNGQKHDNGRPAESAYMKKERRSVLPSLRNERHITKERIVEGEPRVTATMNGMPLGDAVVAMTAPAGFEVKVAPGVNTALPVTLEVKDKSLGESLALLLGPHGYQAVVDIRNKEVRIDVRQ